MIFLPIFTAARGTQAPRGGIADLPTAYCRGGTNFHRFLIPSREAPAPLYAFLLVEPEGRNLIDVIVQPVGKEQVGG